MELFTLDAETMKDASANDVGAFGDNKNNNFLGVRPLNSVSNSASTVNNNRSNNYLFHCDLSNQANAGFKSVPSNFQSLTTAANANINYAETGPEPNLGLRAGAMLLSDTTDGTCDQLSSDFKVSSTSSSSSRSSSSMNAATYLMPITSTIAQPNFSFVGTVPDEPNSLSTTNSIDCIFSVSPCL